MKRTLLEMVQSVLNDMDSEPVNSITDTVEAGQIASVIEDTYYNLIAALHIPEHQKLIQLTALSDTNYPTAFTYPDNTKEIISFEYNGKDVVYVEPLIFLSRNQDSGVLVSDPGSVTSYYVADDRDPSYFTTFDDEHLICNSYNADTEATLQASKTRCLAHVYPLFSQVDTFEPVLDDPLLPYLLAEAKSTCFSLFKSGSDPKIEQAARRLKSYNQNDMYRNKRANTRNFYGRSR